jgi:hypothetical protein
MPRPATAHQTAQARAEALLRAVLSDAEYYLLTTRGYLLVWSPQQHERVYRIPRGRGFVRLYERHIPRLDLCLQSVEPLPADDVVLLHKLLIETDESGYLATANHFPVRA